VHVGEDINREGLDEARGGFTRSHAEGDIGEAFQDNRYGSSDDRS
jgi:hypothetical protein